MKIIGITGKSGSGKSYFSNKLKSKLKNSKIVNVDSVFFSLLNRNETIRQKVIEL